MSDILPEDALALVSKSSPQQRLAISRSDLIRHMSGDTKPRSHPEASFIEGDDQPVETLGDSPKASASLNTWDLLKLGVQTWWRHHPGNMALSVATPLLGRYAHRRPFQLLAISAGVGAAVVLLKPWRLISLGDLTVAALKSSEFSSLVASMLTSNDDGETSDSA